MSVDATIKRRFILKGTLTNTSPLLIGGGEIDKTKDVAFVKDIGGKPYIPGTSIAGCLKKYFQEKYKMGTDMDFLWGQNEKYQAQFVIDNAYLKNEDYNIKIRDGVKIDNASGRAVERGLYNYESLEPGAQFSFEAEIIERGDGSDNPEKFLNTLLKDFKDEKIPFGMGALSSFGFGKIIFENLVIGEFEKVEEWLEHLQTSTLPKEYKATQSYYEKEPAPFLNIAVILKQKTAFIARDYGQDLDDDLKEAIGAERTDKEESSPDSITFMVGDQPVMTAKTVKGALRSQAVTILNTLNKLKEEGYKPKVSPPQEILDDLFGKWIENPGDERNKTKSLLQIEETAISKIRHLQLHQRVSIDRFTGGAMESKLFNSVPVYPDEEEITLNMRLKISENPSKTQAQLGLLVFVFRDLNDKLFSIGGEKSIGRGLFDVREMKINGRDEFEGTIDFEKIEECGERPLKWIKEFHNQINE